MGVGQVAHYPRRGGPGDHHFGGRQGVAANRDDTLPPNRGLPLARTPAQKSDTPVAPVAQPEVLYKIPARIRKYVPSLTFVAALAQAPAAMVV